MSIFNIGIKESKENRKINKQCSVLFEEDSDEYSSSFSPPPSPGVIQGPCIDGLGGRVFNDIDADGINEEAETGPGGVKVQVFGCSDLGESYLIETTFTDLNGDYYFSDPSIALGNQYRIEYSELPEGYVSSLAGVDNLTNTRIVDQVSCNIHFGVINKASFLSLIHI